MLEENIEKLRSKLYVYLKNYHKQDKIELNITPKQLENIIFREGYDYSLNKKYKGCAFSFDLVKKLDLTTVSFDNVNIRNKDFTGSYGVQINPQTVYEKDFYQTKLSSVKIIGSFEGSNISGTDFTGSKFAVINSEEIYNKDFIGTNFADTIITGTFKFAKLDGAIFKGSKGAVIDPLIIDSFKSADLTDTQIIENFENCEHKYNDKTMYNGKPFQEYVKIKKERECIEEYNQIVLEMNNAFKIK